MTAAVLCVDIGTTSLKAGFITANGEVVSVCSENLGELAAVRNIPANYTALLWFPALKNACKKLVSSLSPEQKNDLHIVAVSVSGNGPTVCTESGETVLWSSASGGRGADCKSDDSKSGVGTVGESASGAGCGAGGESVGGNSNARDFGRSLFLPKIWELRERFPAAFESSRYVFSDPEFLIWTLTGNAVTILPEERFVSAYWTDGLLAENGISSKKLPPFCKIGGKYGDVGSEVLEELGLLPFVKDDDEGGCDGKAALLAANGRTQGKLAPPDVGAHPHDERPFHTAGWRSGALVQPSLKTSLPVFGAGPDFVAALIGTGTLQAGRLCDRAGSSEGINFCVSKEIRADGLRTLPSVVSGLWNISALIPDSAELCEEARLQAVFRAVNALKTVSKANGIPFPQKMTVTGGQAKDAAFMQKKANLLGLTLCEANCDEAELLGDACVAWYALGRYGSLAEASEHIVRQGRVYEAQRVSGKVVPPQKCRLPQRMPAAQRQGSEIR